jgi:biotin carboxyl carrier protein
VAGARLEENVTTMRYVATVENKTFVIEITSEGEITVNGEIHKVDMRRIEPLPLYSLLVDNLSHEAFIEEQDEAYSVALEGKLYTVQVQEERAWKQTKSSTIPTTIGGEIPIKAPLPGLVVEVTVTAGQKVQAGDLLLVLESMKMENRLCSPQDGTVKAVHIAARDQVNQGQVLLTLST